MEQLEAMTAYGLLSSAHKAVVGVAGSDADHMAIDALFGKSAEVVKVTGVGELPTMKLMQDYCKCNPDHYICYLHTKGAIHNGAPVYEAWRKCMERVVIGQWKDCVRALECGYDGAGAHWLTPGMYPFIGDVPYFGGNFFWANATHLNKLPEIDIHADRYQAEVWFGKTKKWPKVRDFARHFPMQGCQN